MTEHDSFKALTQGLQWGGNEKKDLTLSSDGCPFSGPDGPLNNCTATSLNASDTIMDIETFGNCIAYPRISQLLSSRNLTIHGQAVANLFDIWSDTAYPDVTTAIVQIQTKCWNQWITHADSVISSMNSPEWSELCGGIYSSLRSVNTDIGGIGVMFMKALLDGNSELTLCGPRYLTGCNIALCSVPFFCYDVSTLGCTTYTLSVCVWSKGWVRKRRKKRL